MISMGDLLVKILQEFVFSKIDMLLPEIKLNSHTIYTIHHQKYNWITKITLESCDKND